jgi:hypothetical protein
MGRGCGAVALEKAAAGGCAAYGKQPCTAAVEKMSNTVFFLRYEGVVRVRSEVASGAGAGRPADARILSLLFFIFLFLFFSLSYHRLAISTEMVV